MNETKMTRALQSVTKVAMRVLEAVPIQEAWTKAQIVGELKRAGGSISVEVVHGGLDYLRGKGLITELTAGRFIRVQARPRWSAPPEPDHPHSEPEAPMPSPPTSTTVSSTAAKDGDPNALARLAELASFARGLSNQLASLADLIDDVALDVEQQLQRERGDLEKLRQFQQLMKSFANV